MFFEVVPVLHFLYFAKEYRVGEELFILSWTRPETRKDRKYISIKLQELKIVVFQRDQTCWNDTELFVARKIFGKVKRPAESMAERRDVSFLNVSAIWRKLTVRQRFEVEFSSFSPSWEKKVEDFSFLSTENFLAKELIRFRLIDVVVCLSLKHFCLLGKRRSAFSFSFAISSELFCFFLLNLGTIRRKVGSMKIFLDLTIFFLFFDQFFSQIPIGKIDFFRSARIRHFLFVSRLVRRSKFVERHRSEKFSRSFFRGAKFNAKFFVTKRKHFFRVDFSKCFGESNGKSSVRTDFILVSQGNNVYLSIHQSKKFDRTDGKSFYSVQFVTDWKMAFWVPFRPSTTGKRIFSNCFSIDFTQRWFHWIILITEDPKSIENVDINSRWK